MEKKLKKDDKPEKLNSLQKIFLISNYFEEPKDKKNWFINQFQNYIKTIKQSVDNITREEKYDRLRKKVYLNSFSLNKINNFPDIKKTSRKFLPIKNKKENKFYLKKFHSNKKINNLYTYNNNSNSNELSKNNSSIFNSDNYAEYNNKSINKSIDTDYIKENSKSQKKNKYYLNSFLDLNTLPNIRGMENKNRYIKRNINNISQKTEILEKKLIKQEKMKYIGFKSKYNRLYNEHKRIQVDLEQYLNPQKDNKYKFNLYQTSGGSNEAKMGNLKKVMKQISNKLKNRQQNKPSISDIIDEVENFKLREKILRERIQKNNKKFDYLVNDSSIIQKRIDIKCKKNNDI